MGSTPKDQGLPQANRVQTTLISTESLDLKTSLAQSKLELEMKKSHQMNRLNWITFAKILYDQLEKSKQPLYPSTDPASFLGGVNQINVQQVDKVSRDNFVKALAQIAGMLPLISKEEYEYRHPGEQAISYQQIETQLLCCPYSLLTWDNLIDLIFQCNRPLVPEEPSQQLEILDQEALSPSYFHQGDEAVSMLQQEQRVTEMRRAAEHGNAQVGFYTLGRTSPIKGSENKMQRVIAAAQNDRLQAANESLDEKRGSSHSSVVFCDSPRNSSKEKQARANMESQVMRQKQSSSSRISEIDDGSDSDDEVEDSQPKVSRAAAAKPASAAPTHEEKKCSEVETQKASAPEQEQIKSNLLKTYQIPGVASQSNGESFTLWEHSDFVSNKQIRKDNVAGHIKSRTNCSKEFSEGMQSSFAQNLGQAYHTGVSFGSPIELKEQIKRERHA